MLYPLSYRGGEDGILPEYCGVTTVLLDDRVIVSAMDMAAIFAQTKTIAIVGMSDNPSRASNDVARYLMDYFEVIPVNPNHAQILGRKCYPDLESIPVKVDMVDVFQRSENVPPYVAPAIAIGTRVFWMQLGIENADAAKQLEAAGIVVVQNRCTKIEHMRLG